MDNHVDDKGYRHVELSDNGDTGGFYLGDDENQKMIPNKKQRKTVALLQDAMRFIGKFPFT